ncbi:MAG: response regulator [Betaproteobacteria bacterium]
MSVCARVLVVEDDLANQQSLSALLMQMGHVPTVANRGDEALRLLDTAVELDVIISDVVMPGMSGIDFARRARIMRPGMPIVLVTGNSEAMESVLASGAVALLKPYSPETLRQVLGESLEERNG